MTKRTERVAQLVRAVVADEMARLPEYFDGVVITGVDVDRELSTAAVYFDAGGGGELADEGDEAAAVTEAFEQNRHRFQRALGDASSLRRTPALRFFCDTSAADAERIEQLLGQIAQKAKSERPDGGS